MAFGNICFTPKYFLLIPLIPQESDQYVKYYYSLSEFFPREEPNSEICLHHDL